MKSIHYVAAASTQGLFTGHVLETTNSITGFTISYGATMSGSMYPIYSLYRTGTTVFWRDKLTARSNTGFSVLLDTATILGMQFWCFRTS